MSGWQSIGEVAKRLVEKVVSGQKSLPRQSISPKMERPEEVVPTPSPGLTETALNRRA